MKVNKTLILFLCLACNSFGMEELNFDPLDFPKSKDGNIYDVPKDEELDCIKKHKPLDYKIFAAGRFFDNSIFAVYRSTEEAKEYKEWREKCDAWYKKETRNWEEFPGFNEDFKVKIDDDKLGFVEAKVHEANFFRDGGSALLETNYGQFFFPAPRLLESGKKDPYFSEGSIKLFKDIKKVE